MAGKYPPGFEVEVPAGEATKVATPEERVPVDNRRNYLGLLPYVGAMVGGVGGGMVGGTAGGIGAYPGAILGAGTGQMGAENIRQGLAQLMGLEQPNPNPDPMEQLKHYAGQFAQGAGAEAIGIPVAGVLGKSGHFLMDEALRPGVKWMRRFAVDDVLPDAAKMQLKERLPVGRIFESEALPSERIRAARKKSSDNTNALLAGSRIRYTPQAALDDVQVLFDRLGASTSAGKDRAEILSLVDDFMNDHPGILTAEEMNKIKQFAQGASKNTIKGRQSGGNVAASDPNWRNFNDAIQKGIRKRLAADIPGLDASNQRTKDLMMLRKVNQAVEAYKPPPVTESAFAPGALLSRAAFSPETLSRLALLMEPTFNNAISQAALRQSPRALEGVLNWNRSFPSDATKQYPPGFEPE